MCGENGVCAGGGRDIANSPFVCLQYVEKVRVFILEKIQYQNNTLSSHNTHPILYNILHLNDKAEV